MSKRSFFMNRASMHPSMSAGKGKPRMVFTRKTHMSKELFQVSHFVEPLSREAETRLRAVTRALMEPGKGILAADESIETIDQCLRSMNLQQTDQNRSKYLDVLLRRGSESCHFLCGLLVREEMSRLKYKGRTLSFLLQQVNVHLGFRADRKYIKLESAFEEWLTTGLDTLEEDCKRFRDTGATFVLWRALYKVTWCTPSLLSLISNSNTLSRFASLSQTTGLVPILSVELLPTGDYSMETASLALETILSFLVKSLRDHHVFMEGLIIRLTPPFPGQDHPSKCDLQLVVKATLQISNKTIPPAVGGIMLARRETLADSVDVLNSVNNFPMRKPLPINFCFSRVIHNDVIQMWAGQEANVEKATVELLARTKVCSLAAMGQCPETNATLFLTKVDDQ